MPTLKELEEEIKSMSTSEKHYFLIKRFFEEHKGLNKFIKTLPKKLVIIEKDKKIRLTNNLFIGPSSFSFNNKTVSIKDEQSFTIRQDNHKKYSFSHKGISGEYKYLKSTYDEFTLLIGKYKKKIKEDHKEYLDNLDKAFADF